MIRDAVRGLLATPIAVAAAVVTLAVAVGVNLAMFGLVGRALLNPPAHVVQPERVFTFRFGAGGDASRPAETETAMTTTSFVTFANIRDHVPALSGAAAFQRSETSAVIDGEQRNVAAMLVTSGYFDVLGARPLIGRVPAREADDVIPREPIAVLSHAFWQSAFAGDRNAIGRRLNVRGTEYTIGAVMPPGFSGHSSASVDLWVPMSVAMADSPGWDQQEFRNILSVIGRLGDGQHAPVVEAQAGAVTGRRVAISAIAGADVAAAEQRVAWWLTGVSVLVFAIGLANAATLLVVRASRRRRDAAVRAALGASRARLVAGAISEGLIIALAATALSLVLAPWLDEAVRRILFPGVIATGIPGASLVAAAVAAGLVAAIVSSLANLWQLPSSSRPWQLSQMSRGGTGRSRALTGLLLVQTALSVFLLAGAGMFGTSLYRLARQDFGMTMDGVVLVDFQMSVGSLSQTAEALAQSFERVRSLPGVERATVIDAIPFGGFNVPPISVPGLNGPPNVGGQLPRLTAATPEFMDLLGVKVVEGRGFTAADEHGPPVVVVNQQMARGVWPGASAIGECIRIGFDPDFDPSTAIGPPTPSAAVPCREVIGVANDVRQRSLLPVDNEARLMEYYVPFTQVPRPPFAPNDGLPVRGFLLRASVPAEKLADPIRRLVVGSRTDLPFLQVRPYTQLLERQMRPWRLGTTLLLWFSALALCVAAVGLYAAFSYAVRERRREVAIRLAVGARPGRVLTMILREALVLAGTGVCLGCVAAVLAGRSIQSLLFGTTPSDPVVLAVSGLVMLLVAGAATLAPAAMASRVEPTVLLRSE